MQQVKLTPEHFHGAVDLEWNKDGSVQPWRIRLSEKELYNDQLRRLASMPAGIRICVRTNTRRLRLTAYPMVSVSRYDYDLVCDGKLLQSTFKPPTEDMGLEVATDAEADYSDKNIQDYGSWNKKTAEASKKRPDKDHIIEFDNIPEGEHTLEIWLSTAGPQRIRGLEVDQGATCEVVKDARPRWIVHGSSITHSMGPSAQQFPKLPFSSQTAHSPARTWPGTAAREGDVHLLDFGFGGQAVMDPIMARTIRDTPAEAISLKFGINVHNTGSHGARSFGQAVMGFVLVVREKHPNTPLQLISPIYGSWREQMTQAARQPGYVGPAHTGPPPTLTKPDPRFLTLPQMRAELKRIVEVLQKRGDKNIQYVDGLQLFNEDDMIKGGMMPDRLHPNGDGYEHMGRNFARISFGPQGTLFPRRNAKL